MLSALPGRVVLAVVVLGVAFSAHLTRSPARGPTVLSPRVPVPGLPAPTRSITVVDVSRDSLVARLGVLRDRALTPARRCQRLALHALGLVRDVEPGRSVSSHQVPVPDWFASTTAYYMPGTDTIITSGATPGALAHEWVHAVDDQRGRRMVAGLVALTTDESLALRASVEGTALMAVPVRLPAFPFTWDLDGNAWILAYVIGPTYIRRASRGNLPAALDLAPRSVSDVLFARPPPSRSAVLPPPVQPGDRLLCSDRLGPLGLLTALRRTRVRSGAAIALARAWVTDRVDRTATTDSSVRVRWRVQFTSPAAARAWARLTGHATDVTIVP